MTDKEILKALGLTKKSCISEQIVQTTHHWLDACEKVSELEKKIDELEQRNAELKGKYAHSAREAGTYEQLFEKMKSALERWYNQHSDKSYTETFYEKLIADTEELLWVNCEK